MEKRTVDFRSTIGLNEAQLAKPVHEKTDAGARCAPPSQLKYPDSASELHGLSRPSFSELCPEQQDSGATQFVHDESCQRLALNIVIVYVGQRFAALGDLLTCGSRSFLELLAFS